MSTITLHNEPQARAALGTLWQHIAAMLRDGKRLQVSVKPETRSLAQNQLMWSVLRDLSAQVKWFGKHMDEKSWKDFITGHLNGQDLVPNMDGTGFISIGLGRSTSDMTRAEMTAVIDLAHAFGAEQNVQWSPTSLGEQE